MAMVELKWTEKRVDEFITPFEERPCFYNMKPREYLNRNKETSARYCDIVGNYCCTIASTTTIERLQQSLAFT